MSGISADKTVTIAKAQDDSAPDFGRLQLLSTDFPDQPISTLTSSAGESTQIRTLNSADGWLVPARLDAAIPTLSIYGLDPTRIVAPTVEAQLIDVTGDGKVVGVMASREGDALLWTSNAPDQWQATALDLATKRSIHGLVGTESGFAALEADGTITILRLGDLLP